jgi:hypothetical protein
MDRSGLPSAEENDGFSYLKKVMAYKRETTE